MAQRRGGDFKGYKVVFTGQVANIRPFAHSLKHFTVAIKEWILFPNPVPRGLFCKMANTLPLVFCLFEQILLL